MNSADDTVPMNTPPVSSSSGSQPQATLLQRGAFDPPFTPGTLGRLDRFEILRLLGEGGMGQVYLAREPRTDTLVAVKIMRPQVADDPQSVHRFLTEARHMYRLSHPRILRVLEVSDRAEGPYYVMPYVEGGSLLGQYSPDKPLPSERVLSVARQVAEALAHAHSHGLIHRDLKPGNVLLDREGNAYLTDFGLVRTVFNDSMVDASASHLEGTAPYMSPAVARGEAEDTRCDIYAFGALLYELLAGQPPYTGRTPQMILDRVLKGPPPPPRTVNPKASPALVRIAEGCMARELRDRYATMSDVVADLERAAQGKAPFGPHRPSGRLPRIAALLAAALAVAGLAGVAVHRLSTSSVDPKIKGGGRPESGVQAQAHKPAATTQAQFTYVTNNSTITITKYTGPGGKVMIPEKIDGLPVTCIGDGAFIYRSDVTQIRIPDSVTRVADAAFFCCGGLTNIDIPKSVTSVGGGAFPFCERLTSIKVDPSNPDYCSTEDGILFDKDKTCLIRYPSGKTGAYAIPDSVRNIGDNAFGGRSKMSSVTIPNGVTNIGQFAFDSCSLLSSLVLPENIVRLGTGAFQCGGLKTIMIPKATISIANYVFTDCRQLNTISVDEHNSAYCSVDGVLFDKARTRLISYPGGKAGSYQAPEGVEEINPAAFNGCACLPSVTLPASVARVGRDAFAKCGDLSAVYFNGNAPWADENVFAESKKVTVYYRPGTTGWGKEFGGRPTAVWQDASTDAGKPAAKTDGPLTCTVDNGAATITKYTGPGGKVVLPKEINGMPVTAIGDCAFMHRGDMTHVSIPNTVKQIGGCAFFNCGGLTQLDLPESVTNVGGQALNFCGGLTRLEIPRNVLSFPAVIGCPKMESIVVDPENPAYWSSPDGVLFNKDKTCLISCPSGKTGAYTIPATVKDIPWGAFQECANLTHVTIPNGVTNIGNYAFAGCVKLAEIMIPASVSSVGFGPFAGDAELPSIRVDAANPAYIEREGVLFDSTGTRLISYPGGKSGSYQVPEGVTEIATGAFSGCRYLPSVTLPASVTRLYENAFAICGDLTTVYFKGNAPWAADHRIFWESNKVTIHYRPGTTGWGKEFGGRPTAVWQDAPADVSQPSTLPETSIHDFACVAENGGVAIVKYTGEGGAVVIPSNVSGLPVTAIKEAAFQNCDSVTGVVIPNSVTNIGLHPFRTCPRLERLALGGLTSISEDMFSGCTNLVNVTIPNTVTNIGCRAFNGCVNLRDISLGAGVRVLDNEAFQDCSSLNKVVIPDNVARIGAATFRRCVNLVSVTISARVMRIEDEAFRDCSRLPQFKMPASVTEIGNRAFLGCESLTAILVDPLNPVLSSNVDGVLFNKEKTLLRRFPVGRSGSYKVPRGVLAVDDWAFEGCSRVTEVTIPDSVTDINPRAFYGCSSLKRVEIPANVARIAGSAFAYCDRLESFAVEDSSLTFTSLDGVLFSKDRSRLVSYPRGRKGNYKIPDSVRVLDLGAFEGCAGLTRVTIPSGIRCLDSNTFRNCSGLKEVNIPDSVVQASGGVWEGGVFEGCTALQRVTVPGSLSVIGDRMFKNCSNLVEVTISEGVRTIGGDPWDGGAFHGCSRLTHVELPKSVTNIGIMAFAKCTNLLSIRLPDPLMRIERAAFFECVGLKRVTIPDHMEALEEALFRGCTNLVAVSLPASIVSIGDMAFDGCSRLSDITIPNGVTNLADCAFRGCASLTRIALPDGIHELKGHWGGGSFNGCAKLGQITIPDHVSVIGVGSFIGCTSLTTVTVGAHVKNVGSWVFGYCPGLTGVYFKGDAPNGANDTSTFEGSQNATVYYRPGTTGWGKEFGGRPTKEWIP